MLWVALCQVTGCVGALAPADDPPPPLPWCDALGPFDLETELVRVDTPLFEFAGCSTDLIEVESDRVVLPDAPGFEPRGELVRDLRALRQATYATHGCWMPILVASPELPAAELHGAIEAMHEANYSEAHLAVRTEYIDHCEGIGGLYARSTIWIPLDPDETRDRYLDVLAGSGRTWAEVADELARVHREVLDREAEVAPPAEVPSEPDPAGTMPGSAP